MMMVSYCGSKDNLQARDVIKMIEEEIGDDQTKKAKWRFNLKFKDANKISKLLSEILQKSKLNIEFIGLDKEAVQTKLKQVRSKSTALLLAGEKEELLKVLDLKELTKIGLIDSNSEIIRSEWLSKEAALCRIKQASAESAIIVKLTAIEQRIIDKILVCSEDLKLNLGFGLEFGEIDPQTSLECLSDRCKIRFSFTDLGCKESLKLIPEIRKANIDFSLKFDKLSDLQATYIIEKASLTQEDIEINKIKTLRESFPKEDKSEEELVEFSTRGIEYLLEISEKKFVPWRSFFAVVMLSSLQTTAGIILVMSGFGANVGMGLITEGVADLIIAYRVYSTRHFSWEDYTKQKTVSLIISAVSMGLQSLKDAGKGINNVVNGVKSEVLEQAGTNLIINGRSVGTKLIQTGKNLKSLAFKQTLTATGEAVLREGLNKAVDSLSHLVMDELKPMISEVIHNKVQSKFYEASLSTLIRKIHSIEGVSEDLGSRIDKIVNEIIQPESNFWQRQWVSLGGPLCKGILSDSKFLGNNFSHGIRIVGILNGMTEIPRIISNVHTQLVKRLSQLDMESLKYSRLIQISCGIDQNSSISICNDLKKRRIIEVEEDIGVSLVETVCHKLNKMTFDGPNVLNMYVETLNSQAFSRSSKKMLIYRY